MKQNYSLFKKISCVFTAAIFLYGWGLKAQTTQTFSYTGLPQSFIVPSCVTSVTITALGAQGGNLALSGALGGGVKGVLAVTAGQVLNIYVGGQPTTTLGGFNGGGNGGVSFLNNGAGGGGASDVRLTGSALANRIIVGGGGGGVGSLTTYNPIGGDGGGGTSCLSPLGFGGAGGAGCSGILGGPGGCAGSTAATGYGTGGAGGGLNSGGAISGSGTGAYGGAGVLGIGGDGGGYAIGPNADGAGGGGGGYYGGAGGMSGSGGCNGGGGGGSSYANNTLLTTITFTAGTKTGNGLVILTYDYNGPGVLANSSASVICIGSTATLSASNVSTYTWNPGNSATTSIVVSPTTATIYTVQGTNSIGCLSTATLAIGINTAVPSLSVATSASSVCLNKPVTLTASGATTYTWTSSVTNGAPYIPSITSDYTVTGGNACGTSTAVTSVTVLPLPNVTAGISSPTVCNGSTIILNGGGSVGGYTWTAGAPNNSAFVPPATNVYTVTGIAANGCTATAAIGVTVLVTPTITPVVTPTAICLGANAVLSAVGATGYTWTPGTNLFASTATVSPAAATTYTLVRTNGLCSSTTTLNLVVNPLPLVNASATPSQICTGAPINLVVIGPITNTWSPGGFTQSNFNVYPNFSTSYTVTGSNGSCTAQAIVPIVVNPSPVISINSSTNTICQGSSATLTVSGTGPLTYTWSSGNNGVTEVVSSNSSTIISVSATNTLNCVSSLNQLILVNPLPNMSVIASPSFICAGDQAILSLTQATASTNNNVAYTWSAPGSGPNITVTPTLTTTYNVAGTNTITGCQNSNSVTLAVYISTFSISSPTAICKGETATLTAAGQPTSYVWTVVSGNNTAPSVTVSPVINTTYSVTGINGSCSTTSQVAVVVNPIPNVTALVAKGQICKFEISTITGSGANTYSWSTGASTPVLSFTLSVTTNYTLTGTDLNGCAKTVTVSQFVATCLGVEDTKGNANVGLNVYPNPNNGNFIITSDANITLNVINSLGQVISTMKLSEENKKEITVSTLPNGIYFITGEANGQKVTKKIIVEK